MSTQEGRDHRIADQRDHDRGHDLQQVPVPGRHDPVDDHTGQHRHGQCHQPHHHRGGQHLAESTRAGQQPSGMVQRPERGSSARLECLGRLQQDGDPAVQIVDGLPAEPVAARGGIDDGHPAPRCRLQTPRNALRPNAIRCRPAAPADHRARWPPRGRVIRRWWRLRRCAARRCRRARCRWRHATRPAVRACRDRPAPWRARRHRSPPSRPARQRGSRADATSPESRQQQRDQPLPPRRDQQFACRCRTGLLQLGRHLGRTHVDDDRVKGRAGLRPGTAPMCPVRAQSRRRAPRSPTCPAPLRATPRCVRSSSCLRRPRPRPTGFPAATSPTSIQRGCLINSPGRAPSDWRSRQRSRKTAS